MFCGLYAWPGEYTGCPEMNRTGFNSYNSILIIVNKLIIRLYTGMIRHMIVVQTNNVN